MQAVLFLALTFVGVAGIYIVLSADFVAVAQVLIYAGADRRADDVRRHAHAGGRPPELRDGVPGAGADPRRAACSRSSSSSPTTPTGASPTRRAFPATAASLGEAFLKPYVVPFEIASVLLMTAMIGAIVLTQEDEEDDDA